jgi:hypothetical protein
VKRSLLIAPLLALACGSNNPPTAIGEFSAPFGVAATGAGDRDLLFIANSGRDGLRALELCSHALLLDGGVDPADTCPSNENGQFVPAPIRLFPATIETGDRPVRVAGVRLSRADGSAAGVALVVGADSTVAVVDARTLLEAQNEGAPAPQPVLHSGDLGARAVDVVAANPVDPDTDIEVAASPGGSVTTFLATETDLLVLDVRLDANGFAQVPTVTASCSLAPVVPSKIALVPGSADQVYVADGAGDGVVAITTASITGIASGPCVTDRISAGGRSVSSVSLSPRWYDGSPNDPPHGPGDLMLMVVEPLDSSGPDTDLDPGGVLIAQTGIGGASAKGLLPIPPFPFSDTTSERMQPLSTAGFGLIREATFLRAVKPRFSPKQPDLKVCTAAPCTPLYIGQPTTAPTHLFNLLAAVTNTDGGTFFIDIPNRQFANANRYVLDNDAGLLPTLDQIPLLSPALLNPPTLTIDPLSFQSGVTNSTIWRAVWHAPIRGIDRRGGSLTHTTNGTLLFTSSPANFSIWQNDPAIHLGAGDVVSFGSLSLAGDSSAACQNVVNNEIPYRFELSILSVGPDTLELAELPDTPDKVGFHPDGCSVLGGVVEVRTGGTSPWLLYEGATARERLPVSGTFSAHQRRFDYSLSRYDPGDPTATPPRPPQAALVNDIAFNFTLTGPEPTAQAAFTWSLGAGEGFVEVLDSVATAGLATAIYAYSSPRAQSLVFTSITGSNELLQSDPSVLSSNITAGIVVYR